MVEIDKGMQGYAEIAGQGFSPVFCKYFIYSM